MKAIIITIILALLAATAYAAGVEEELAQNNTGQTFIRLHNYLPRAVSCYYKDSYNYFTFIIPPQTSTSWQPVYGAYIWQCK